jgi:hypothetical protein
MMDGRILLRSRNLLYQDEVGRDAGGIGGVTAREGRPSQMELSLPVLSDAVVEEIRRHEVLGMHTLSAVFPLRGGAEALHESLHRLRSEAKRAVHGG